MNTALILTTVVVTLGISICQAGEQLAAKAQDSKGCGNELVWWEGELPSGSSDNLGTKHPFDCSHENLSGGKSFGGTSKEGTWVEYEVDVPRDGKWIFYIRKFYHHGPFRYQWNGVGDWVPIDPNHAPLLDTVTLNEHIINWVPGGIVELKKGKNKLRIEAIEKYGPFVFDCFMLTAKPVKINGKLKPGEKLNRSPEGWFPFEPDYDNFEPAALDLRGLNEKEAGSQGRIIARDDDLVFAKTGQKVRFWGVVINPNIWLGSKTGMDHLARQLAKSGINLARLHVPNMADETPGVSTAGLQYLFTALKKQGIYTYVNWYCTACGYKGFNSFGVWYFEPKAQEKWQAWAKCLLGTVNPYTGIPLAQDPALVTVELLDEDTMFFFTMNPKSYTPEALAILEKKFGDWLTARYGSLEKASHAWGKDKYPEGDNFSEGRVALYPAFKLGGADWAKDQRNPLRAGDEVEFLANLMRDWYISGKKWLHDELGYEGLVVGSNFHTADPQVLGPLNQYANCGVDVTALNTYFGGMVKGPRVAYMMAKDDFYTDCSILKEPAQAILMHIQSAGHPHFFTEGGWIMPNRFRAEESLLMSCYGSLQGLDAYCPFELQADWLNTECKWPIQVPVTLGQYPAASLMFRKYYVKEGPPAINEALTLKDLYALKGSGMSQRAGEDMAHSKDIEGSKPNDIVASKYDPLAFYVGRVFQTIGENPGKSEILPDLDKLIDRKDKIVKSATGELTLDYGKGVATVNAPCAQGAAGFLQAFGTVKLADTTIDLKDEYGSVLVVSLDGKPIKESGKILIQVMTEEKNFGWETKDSKIECKKPGQEKPVTVECKQIVSMGEAPICVKKFAGSVSLNRPDAASIKVTPLDFEGYVDATKKVQTAKDIQLLDTTMYYIIGD